jgi:hypothetical protein
MFINGDFSGVTVIAPKVECIVALTSISHYQAYSELLRLKGRVLLGSIPTLPALYTGYIGSIRS